MGEGEPAFQGFPSSSAQVPGTTRHTVAELVLTETHRLNTSGLTRRPEILLAVMGITGVGKTSFINVAMGEGPVMDNVLESCKQNSNRKSTSM